MAKLNQFAELALDLAPFADFVTVYTEEAHPTDGWAFRTNKYHIKTHASLLERRCAAENVAKVLGNSPVDLFLDSMENTACLKYAASPERLYVVYEGKIVYQGAKGPIGYKTEEVRTFLETYKPPKSKIIKL